MDVVTYAALKAEIDALGGHIDEDVAEATEAWLDENVDPDTGYVLDRTLAMENAAAPADLVGDLKSATDTLGDAVLQNVNAPVNGQSDYNTSITYGTGINNLYCFDIHKDAGYTVSKVKIRAKASSSENPEYKFKLFSWYGTTNIYVRALSEELTLEAPTDTYEDETVTLTTPFEVAAGDGIGIITSEFSWLGYSAITLDTAAPMVVRSQTYTTIASDTRLWAYMPTFNKYQPALTMYTTAKGMKDFAMLSDLTPLEADIDELEDDVEASQDKIASALNGKNIIWELGNINSSGVPTSADNMIRTAEFLYLTAGTFFWCGSNYTISVYRYDSDFAYVERELTLHEFTVGATGFYKFVLLATSFNANALIPFNSAVSFTDIQSYSPCINDAINYVNTQDTPIRVADTNVKMAHDSSLAFDGNDMWVAYYCDESTYEESLNNLTTYIAVKKLNPYTRTEIASTTFKVGDTIGDYTQSGKAPYIPKLVVYDDYVLMYFLGWDAMGSELEICSCRIDKSTLALSNFAVCTLEDDDGVEHDMTCSGISAVYKSYTDIEYLPSIIGFTAQPQKYNGYWYNTLNSVFGTEPGMNTLFIKSSDGINWTVDRVMTEVGVAQEASFVIKDGYVYVASRAGTALTRYSIDPTVATYIKVSLPLCITLKTAMCLYRDTIVLTTNIRCVSVSGQTNNRKNFGIFTIDENCNIKLKSRIITEQGMHYPALAVANDELWMAWSNDYRFLNRQTQRTNIAVSKIAI